MRNELRGGDQWYNARTGCRCFCAAAVVHQRGETTVAAVAQALGIPYAQAYAALAACARRPGIYHLRHHAPGRFAPLASRERERVAIVPTATTTAVVIR